MQVLVVEVLVVVLLYEVIANTTNLNQLEESW